MLQTFINTLLSAETDAVCGAEYGVVSPERMNRNGYRHRDFDTRADTIDVAVPKLRQGSYFPEWLLEQDDGGALLEDAASPRNVIGDVKWRTPESTCAGFPDAGVSPDSSNSIHFNTTPPPPSCKLPPAIGQSESC